MYFEKYANGNPNNFEPNASGLTEKVFPTEESQVKSIATGFKKLKLDQIEKLKDLRQ